MILTRLASTSDTAVIVGLAILGIAWFVVVPIARYYRGRSQR